MRKQHLALILAILLLSGCSSGTAETERESVPETEMVQQAGTETVLQPETEVPETETEEEPTDSLPERDYGGADYIILTAAEQWAHTYDSDELNGETLNDAVFTRNLETEERFGVNLNYEIMNGYSAGITLVTIKLRESVMGGDSVYDLVVANIAYCAHNITSGMFQDQIPMEYLDFDAPWYYQEANKSLTIGGRLFTSAGAYGLATLRETPCVFFNKKLMTEIGREMPYNTVLDGKWTWDEMYSMASEAALDMNGDGIMDASDRFGILSTGQEAISFLAPGMGFTVTDFDEEGIPYYVGATEHNVDVMTLLQELMQNTDVVRYTQSVDPVAEMLPMFTGDNGLFTIYTLRLVEYDEMREMEDFGIIPIPKYDEAQEKYVNSAFKDIAAIPSVVKDVEMSQIVLESMNCATYRDVIPKYYDIVLQRKLSRDEESAAMIDIISESGTLDVNMAFYRELTQPLYAVNQITENFATWWAQNQTAVEIKLNKLMEKLAELPS